MVGGKFTQCFIPNPGRMRELLYPGSKVYLLEKCSQDRKTKYNLVLVDLEGTLVSVDSLVPNQVVRESIDEGTIQEFQGLKVEKQEYTFGESRLDFLLSGGSDRLLLEVKSCTLVRRGVALFPDAPTLRGSRHLGVLMEGLRKGRAAIIFLIQRPDVNIFVPNEETDPEFTERLKLAYCRGVEVYVYSSRVTLEGVFLDRKIPMELCSKDL
jgi:sugar fermentation stimulation protein A